MFTFYLFFIDSQQDQRTTDSTIDTHQNTVNNTTDDNERTISTADTHENTVNNATDNNDQTNQTETITPPINENDEFIADSTA